MGQLSFLVLSEQADSAEKASKLLEETGQAKVLEAVVDLNGLAEALRQHHPDALFVELGEDPDAVLDELEKLPLPRPLLVLAGRQDANDLVLRAMRLGAKEFLAPEPSPAELRSALERMLVESQTGALKSQAPVIAVMGAKGGVGATVVACQLAARLQGLGHRTVLVDLNLPLGDVALHLDIEPGYTLADLARESDRVDATFLQSILQEHSSGVEVLAAPNRVEEAELIRGQHVERTVEILRGEFDCVVLDVSRSWSEASVRALDLADQILLVTLLDVPTLSHARQHVDLLQRLGHDPSKIRLIANRCAKVDSVTLADYAQFLGRAPDIRLPNDFRTTVACVNQGKTIGEIAPKRPIHAAFGKLAKDVRDSCGLEAPADANHSGLRGRLSTLFGRKR